MTSLDRPAPVPVGAARRLYSVTVFIVLASLDNVAIGLVPPLYTPIGRALRQPESVVSVVTAVSFLVTAMAAVGWAYFGDRTNRKPLLMIGTLIWSAGTAATALSGSFGAFLAAQILASIGLGAVASVGFSVVSDLISPRRRGLVMSLWGLSQAVGSVSGTLIGGLLGAGDWRRPFLLLTALGVAATLAYTLTYDIRRGQSEPDLAPLFEAGGEYDHRISPRDLRGIADRRSNVWLILQGLTAQMAFGSLVWLPRLFQAKVEAQGYAESTAIQVGSLFATLFQLGGILSIVGGLIGDRLQRRTPRGRALVAAVGILGGIPLYIVLFLAPLKIDIPQGAGSGGVIAAVLGSVVSEPTVAVSFLVALVALALTSANSPNWFALIVDVNPPEHRGTVYSAGNLVNGVGRALGNSLVGAAFRALASRYSPPTNFALGLSLFQLFFIPTGIMYYLASRTTPADIATVRTMLRDRAATEAPTADQLEDIGPRPQ
jgi:MFS family permease